MKIEITCDHCGESFRRGRNEVNRAIKLGRKQFCTASCARSGKRRCSGLGNPQKLSGYSGNRRDNLSPFRWFLLRIKQRNKTYDVTLDDLVNQWEVQQGRCPYTGWNLELPKSTLGFDKDQPRIRQASLDRIDSSKGYVRGNIEFVSVMFNFAKNDFKTDDVIDFCRAVTVYKELR